jgi:eukaryotic-like serine/threonine-protein kinase
MTPVSEGEILAGKYRVERVLGVGGMGVVVAALHLQLDERVAIKFLLPEALTNAEAVARFAREARAAVKIKSQHVARVIDVGTLETGAPYMVMEFLKGQDLSNHLRQSGALPIADAVDFVLQACEALAEAHALGIVHRDLKPANLFLTTLADGSPCVKVLDFGISKVTNPGASGPDLGMTKTQAVMGSPLYMSPEQMASSRDVDGRADIWAIGTILYELVTGRVPFNADTMPQLCAMILQHPPDPPRSLRPDVPDGLTQVMLRCLEKDRTRRFANVAELAAALAPFGSRAAARSAERVSRVLSAAGISSSQLSIPSSQGQATESATNAAWGQTQSRRSNTAIWVVLALLVLGGAAASAVFLLPSREPTASAPSSTAEPATASPASVAPPLTTALPPPDAVPAATASATASTTASSAPSAASAPTATVRPVARGPRTLKPAPRQPTPSIKPTAKPAPVDLLEGRR